MKKTNNIIDLGERGKFNNNNKLNNLTGKEWIKFTKSWFIHKPKRRNNEEILHPAKFPESLVEEFISFFTKENDWVFDPFLGTGSTLIASGNLNRNAIGIELNDKYYKISKKRIAENNFENSIITIKGNSNNLINLFDVNEISQKIDFTITSPPYWNQLERNSLRQKKRNENGLDTKYSQIKSDIGNIKNYDEFLETQANIFDQVYDITKDKGYLTIITNNIFYQSKVFPLAYDTAISLTKRGSKSWVLKDEKIWLQDDKPLIALGVNSAWVGNRHHQYCLIFRKEN
ncbi:MAG: DNA methyltransferase [Melioribacteraceae bacterium]|jgi:DNA modification methylase